MNDKNKNTLSTTEAHAILGELAGVEKKLHESLATVTGLRTAVLDRLGISVAGATTGRFRSDQPNPSSPPRAEGEPDDWLEAYEHETHDVLKTCRLGCKQYRRSTAHDYDRPEHAERCPLYVKPKATQYPPQWKPLEPNPAAADPVLDARWKALDRKQQVALYIASVQGGPVYVGENRIEGRAVVKVSLAVAEGLAKEGMLTRVDLPGRAKSRKAFVLAGLGWELLRDRKILMDDMVTVGEAEAAAVADNKKRAEAAGKAVLDEEVRKNSITLLTTQQVRAMVVARKVGFAVKGIQSVEGKPVTLSQKALSDCPYLRQRGTQDGSGYVYELTDEGKEVAKLLPKDVPFVNDKRWRAK